MGGYNQEISSQYDKLVCNRVNYNAEASYVEGFFPEHTKFVLDVGCGTGAHSLVLSEKYKIVGIDLSEEMIDIAKKKTTLKNPTFLQTSIEEFKPKNNFNVVISLYNVINHIESLNELDSFFKNIRRVLNKNGIFIFDCLNQIAMSRTPPTGEDFFDIWQGKLVLRYFKETENLKNSFELENRIWSNDILLELLKNNNFEIIQLYKKNTLNNCQKDDYKLTYVCKGK